MPLHKNERFLKLWMCLGLTLALTFIASGCGGSNTSRSSEGSNTFRSSGDSNSSSEGSDNPTGVSSNPSEGSNTFNPGGSSSTFNPGGDSNTSKSNGKVSISPRWTMLDATQTLQYTADVKNLDDKTVIWEIAGCSLDDCGTISPDGLYTAPSVVPHHPTPLLRIKATSRIDPTVSDTVLVGLLGLSVRITSDSMALALGAGEEHQFTAAVMRHPNQAVTWSLSGCTASDCGSIDANGLYVGPASVSSRSSVTVTARSQADPSRYSSRTVYQMPIEVSVPPWLVVPPEEALDLRANVKYDPWNAGVTWALEPGCSPETCGILTNHTETSVTYTAPKEAPDPSTVILVATSVADTDKSSEVTVTISDTLTLLEEGDYAFYFSGDGGWDGKTYAVWSAGAGSFHCDGYGNITDGVQDLNLPSGVFQSVPFTGTYTVGPDYRGIFQINTSEGTSTYFMTVDPSGSGGRFITFDDSSADSPSSVTGYFELRDESAFSLSSVVGPYAIGISSGGREMAAVGRFDTDGTGNIGGGRMDVTEYVYNGGYFTPTVTRDLSLTGFLNEPSADTGRGTAAVTLSPTPPGGAANYNFAYYVISDQKILLVQTDNRTSEYTTVLSGEMRRQEGPFSASSLDASSIFSLSGLSVIITGATIGRMDPDGAGSVTGVIDIFDGLDWDFPPIRNEEFWGSYSIESDGSAEIALEMNLDFDAYNRYPSQEEDHIFAFYLRNSNQTYVAYFFGQNQGFLMQTSGNRGSYPSLGGFKPQAAGPFRAESISETFLTTLMPDLSEPCTERGSGLTTFDVTGNVTSSMDINPGICSMDINQYSDIYHREFIGQYTVSGNGRGTIMLDGVDPEMVFWIISPLELVAVSDNYFERVLIEYWR